MRWSKPQAAPGVVLITTKLGDEHCGIGHRLQHFWHVLALFFFTVSIPSNSDHLGHVSTSHDFLCLRLCLPFIILIRQSNSKSCGHIESTVPPQFRSKLRVNETVLGMEVATCKNMVSTLLRGRVLSPFFRFCVFFLSLWLWTGWGGVGMLTFFATARFSCTSTHTSCYATASFSCTFTHTSCYATASFSCTFTQTSCYATARFLLHIHTNVMLRYC